VWFASGTTFEYGALLLATGAEPVRLPDKVVQGRRVYYLRTVADSRAIVAAAKQGKCAVVIGASFIGLEVAASLRARGLDVHVVAPEARPLERVLGPQFGDFIRGVHEEHGVRFHLGQTVTAMTPDDVTLATGERIACDLVVAGVGVRPRTTLAEQAGLGIDRGVVVNERLATSVAGIFAAGDIARYPDPRLGVSIRVEHWAHAQWQGQTAARNILGAAERFDSVPFFWSNHYDVAIAYVGHAEQWDGIEFSGALDARDCAAAFRADGKVIAVASVGRDRVSLQAEVAMEDGREPALAEPASR
jgi:NADPH-dependent 2,4-dienoyl-CoA reductase/sulfur reductase-like enzyme